MAGRFPIDSHQTDIRVKHSQDKIKAPDHEGQGLKFIDIQGILTFRELWSATCCFEAVFLTFRNTGSLHPRYENTLLRVS